jgi:hypothetical protein
MKGQMGDRNAFSASVREMANLSTQIVATAKGIANTTDPNTSARLLAAAKLCADAVSALVLSAKSVAANPTSAPLQANLYQSILILLDTSGRGQILQYDLTQHTHIQFLMILT